MLNERFFLSEGENVPYLDVYIPNKYLKREEKRPFLLVCPGGGYFFCNQREAENIALRYCGFGFNVAVLTYSTDDTKDRYPKQLVELAKAMDFIKKKAGEWNSTPDGIYVIGFSAGGHLAACLGAFWNKEKAIAQYDCKPRGLLLCYTPFLTGEFENKRTFDDLCGDDKELRKHVNLDDKVDSTFPPCFIWHTYEDEKAMLENPLFFAVALRKANVPFELHIFQKGIHALSLCEEYTAEVPAEISEHVKSWTTLALEWMREDFKSFLTTSN